MIVMLEEDKNYHCEDCGNFNENEIPANCLKGHGKVAFRHPVCPDFSRIVKFDFRAEETKKE